MDETRTGQTDAEAATAALMDSTQDPSTADPGPVTEMGAPEATATPAESAQGSSVVKSAVNMAIYLADEIAWRRDVQAANKTVRDAKDKLEIAKLDQKCAKDALDASVSRLSQVISEWDQPKLPFGEPAGGDDGDPVLNPPGIVNDVINPPTTALVDVEDPAWRGLSVASLKLTCQGHLEAEGLHIIGALLNWQKSGNKLTDIGGVGEATASFIQSALEDSWKAWSERDDESSDDGAISLADARWLATEVATLALSPKTRILLASQGFKTIGHIADWTNRNKRLQDIKGVGDATAKLIEEALEEKQTDKDLEAIQRNVVQLNVPEGT